MLVRHALQVFMENEGDFVEVILLYCYPGGLPNVPTTTGAFLIW
jgi:hypothetical protein